MRNIKLTIEYDGTNYHGWQSQINAITVQEVVQNAVRKLTGEDCNLIGASRTDTGVHALGQTANFTTQCTIPANKFSYALNSILPKDIVINNSVEADQDFHSRFSAKGKKYRYLILNSPHPSALFRNRTLHVSKSLDIKSMQKSIKAFLGKHDFSAFRSTGNFVSTAVRTITSVSLIKREDIIEFEIEGDGFLYNMVRIIVGTLIEVGTGRIIPEDIPEIINSLDRKEAGKTAPPQGLYLLEVYY